MWSTGGRIRAVRVAGYVGRAPQPPHAPTLIYDDGCGFCRRWVERAKRLDARRVVRTLPLEHEVASQVSGQPVMRLRQAVHFVRRDGEVFAGAAAVRELSRHLRGGWIVRAVAALPGVMPVAERAYVRIARRWGPLEV
jgi:predicted DCC family thiol-disulfide oxidoreductase YuxK